MAYTEIQSGGEKTGMSVHSPLIKRYRTLIGTAEYDGPQQDPAMVYAQSVIGGFESLGKKYRFSSQFGFRHSVRCMELLESYR